MKLVVLISAAGWGGGERAALSLARDLARSGDEVLVAGRGGGLLEAEVSLLGLRFADACPGDGLDLLGLARLAGLLRRERPELVHAHLNRAALWGGLAARVAGVPLVATAHGLTRAGYYRLAHRVIAVSEAVAAHLRALVPRLALSVILNPLDPVACPDGARTAAVRRELAPAPGDRVLLVAAKLHPNKGQRLAIDAVSRLPDTRLVLAGDGPDRDALSRHAAAAGIAHRVTFLGHRTDVTELMAASDALLVPSEREAFSLSAAESLLCGTPVIAARTGGLPEVLGPDGVLVDSRDPSDWAAAIAAVLADLPAARARAAAAGPRLMQSCAPERILAQTRALYADLLEAHKRTPGRR